MTNAETLIRKGKRGAAAFVQAECMASKAAANGSAPPPEVPQPPAHLQALLDHLLHPGKDINDMDMIDWCRWLVGGGEKPEDFSHRVQEYNNTVMCGLVWTANFVAYRCSTCRISQCMSLCADCFHNGNHEAEGHDYNMFKSQAGGACDCGDASVMRKSGFCKKHGQNTCRNQPGPPDELMCVAENMLPKMILRLLQHLREKSVPPLGAAADGGNFKVTVEEADAFLSLLQDFCDMGTAMRNVIIRCLISRKIYTSLTTGGGSEGADSEYVAFMRRSKEKYEAALNALPVPELSKKYCECPTLTTRLVHTTFLDELLFWTVRYEFPQKLVCLLLIMLPDQHYKEVFTRAFVFHYWRMSTMLDKSGISDSLSNRVIHVSVQLFSNEELTLRMTEQLHLLHIIVYSIKSMMSSVLTLNTLGDVQQNYHEVVDCGEHVMKDHCYWPLVSDLNNVLSHPSIAYKFMEDEKQLAMWFDFLPMFQGMNVNTREMDAHIEFEPNTYYAAFSAELEASASPMWSLVSHLKDASTRHLTRNVISHCLTALRGWFEAIYFSHADQLDRLKVSFHLPLHRYYSVFVRQAVRWQGFSLEELLPDNKTLHLMMMHPLSVQVAFYEIMCQMWVRNGLQIKGQAMTYIQCHFSNSMVDADIFLLQLCCSRLDPALMVRTVLDRFHVMPWLSLDPEQGERDTGPRLLEPEQEVPMMESALIFLTSLITLRTNLGLSEQELTRLEMVTLLCMEDKTHSTLTEQMPEKNGSGVTEDFERMLTDVGQFREPQFEAGGTMQQGMYAPKPAVWETMYDPIYVLLRAVHRKDFQSSFDRFISYVQKNGRLNGGQGTAEPQRNGSPWPPWRLPSPCYQKYADPRRLLQSRYAHGLIFNLLYKAVHQEASSENITSLTLFLLELALSLPQTDFSGKEVAVSTPWFILHEPLDLQYETWFPTDWLSANLRHTVTAIFGNHSEPGSSSMEVDQVSDDAGSSSDTESPPYLVETPTSDGGGPEGGASPPPSHHALYDHRSAAALTLLGSSSKALVPFPPGIIEPVRSLVRQAVPELPLSPPALGAAALALTADGLDTSSTSSHEMSMELAASAAASSTAADMDLLAAASGHHNHHGQPSGRQQQLTGSQHRTVVNVNESIISLLLKFHSKLTGRQDSYVPVTERAKVPSLAPTTMPEYRESRIGDGAFFVEKVLDKICELDEACEHSVKLTRIQLWPVQHAREAQEDQQQERDEQEARRRRAKERQAKMMKDFAERQKKFMKQLVEDDNLMEDDASMTTSKTVVQQEYDCVHCHQTQPSTLDKPMGLVVLLQATSVLGHKHRDINHLILPVREEDRALLAIDDSLASEYDRRFEELCRHFDPRSCQLAVNAGWQGGVFVQSCGHHVHLACHQSYVSSLRGSAASGLQQSSQTLAVERGEYMCPMCRQLANSVLPIPPDPEASQMVRARSQCAVTIGHEVTALLREPPAPPSSSQSQLMTAMSLIMDNLMKATYSQYLHRSSGGGAASDPGNDHALVMFVSSVARTNLEVDLVSRGGALITAVAAASASPLLQSTSAATSRLLSRSSCFQPLLHVLAIHMKFRLPKPLFADWCQVSGLWTDEDERSLLVRRDSADVPMLLRDTATLLIHFFLVLPVQIDQVFFTCLVRQLYNLAWLQASLKLACRLPANLRHQLRDEWQQRVRLAESQAYTKVDTVPLGVGLVASALNATGIFNSDEEDLDYPGAKLGPRLTPEDLELAVQQECLCFMRVAALLRHYAYSEPLPEIWEPDWEFTRLAQFLGMADNDISGRVASGPCLGWLTAPAVLSFSWCGELAQLATRSQLWARRLVMVNCLWRQPQLLRLPRSYDSIFQFYYKRMCSVCGKVPKDPSICLLCGTMVCLREACCKSRTGEHEAVRHSVDCGAGTVPYLAVNSATIVVIRGRRACIWGSIYLDAFGEEDRELKRGKPLFLSADRYQLLESQWLAHRFDHTNRKWIWHRESL